MSSADIFLIFFSPQKYFRNTIRVTNSLEPDQVGMGALLVLIWIQTKQQFIIYLAFNAFGKRTNLSSGQILVNVCKD